MQDVIAERVFAQPWTAFGFHASALKWIFRANECVCFRSRSHMFLCSSSTCTWLGNILACIKCHCHQHTHGNQASTQKSLIPANEANMQYVALKGKQCIEHAEQCRHKESDGFWVTMYGAMGVHLHARQPWAAFHCLNLYGYPFLLCYESEDSFQNLH